MGRDNFQAQAVQNIKDNLKKIGIVVSQYAGKSGKPQTPKDQVNQISGFIDEVIEPVAIGRHWNSNILTLWEEFKDTFERGEGNWTKSKKIIQDLNERFKDIEP